MERILWFSGYAILRFTQAPTIVAVVAVAQIHTHSFGSLFFGHGPSGENNAYWFLKVGTLSDNICTILLIEFRHYDVCVCMWDAAKKLKNNLTLPQKPETSNAFQIVAVISFSNYICFASTRKFNTSKFENEKEKKRLIGKISFN